MKLIAFVVFFNFTCNALLAQAPFFAWARQLKGNVTAVGLDIAVDHIGNVYTTGYFNGTCDFDPGPGTFLLYGVNQDCFVSKLDAAGSFVWAKQIKGCHVFSLTVDFDDNIYICGVFTGTVDFDPGPGIFNLTGPTAANSVFICKFNPSGNLIWAKKIANRSVANAIKTDASNNVYVTGFFLSTVDFDPGPSVFNLTSNDWDNAFILKLTNVGDFLWAKKLTSAQGSDGLSLHFDSFGNVFTSGYFAGTIDMDPGPSVFNLTASKEDFYFSKLDPSGNFVWGKQVRPLIPDLDHSAYVHADTDPAGNVFITGFARGPVDLDPGVTDYVLNDSIPFGFIAKWNSAGSFVWAKKLDGAGFIRPEAISVNHSGVFFTTGYFSGPIDFDPGTAVFNLTSAGPQDIYIAKYDSSGNFVWTGQLNGTGKSTSFANFVDSHSNIYTTGYFSDSVDFDPGTAAFILHAEEFNSLSIWDAFVHKMSQCANPTTSVLNVNTCDNYVLNNYSYGSSGTYHQAVLNALGCDSIIELHLTVNRSFSNINAVICTGQLVAGYDSPGVYIDTFKLTNGCDSIRTLRIAPDSTCTTAAFAIPNAFSPNGDGLNDVFRPVVRGAIQQYHCIIYNRWGNKIFETRDYHSGWDGRFKGNLLPTGTYVYFIQFKQGGVEKNYEGAVHVVR